MNAAEAPLRFPIIFCSPKDSSCGVQDSIEPSAHMSLVKGGYYDGAAIIDSGGARWKVTRVDVKGGRGRFGGWTIWLDRRVWIDLNIEHEGEAGPSDVRALMIKSVDAAREYWDEAADSEWLKAQLEKARDIPSLITTYEEAGRRYEEMLMAMPDE
jgi:hypothetical protein